MIAFSGMRSGDVDELRLLRRLRSWRAGRQGAAGEKQKRSGKEMPIRAFDSCKRCSRDKEKHVIIYLGQKCRDKGGTQLRQLQ